MAVERTFAFVDLSGFTDYTEAHREEDVAHVLTTFRATARLVASRRGVRVAKWLGDGAMFVAVEPTPCVATMLEIQARVDCESPLAIRAGMAGGRVMLFDGDDYVGTPVNLAARLCDEARPHQVLATPEVAATAPPWAVCADEGTHTVRGFPRPIPVVAISRARSDDTATVRDPVCLLDLPEGTAVATRAGADGTAWFCSDSCAEAWDEHRAAGCPDAAQ